MLSPAEVDALFAALRTSRDRAMVEAMVLGGMRRCEVLGLDLGDIKAGERRVFISQGKGGHQRRVGQSVGGRAESGSTHQAPHVPVQGDLAGTSCGWHPAVRPTAARRGFRAHLPHFVPLSNLRERDKPWEVNLRRGLRGQRKPG